MKKILVAVAFATLPALAQQPQAPQPGPQMPPCLPKMECPMAKQTPCPKGHKMGHPCKMGHPGTHAYMKGFEKGFEEGFEEGFEAGLRMARKMHHKGPKGMHHPHPGMKPGCPMGIPGAKPACPMMKPGCPVPPPAPAPAPEGKPAPAPAPEAPVPAPEAAPAQA